MTNDYLYRLCTELLALEKERRAHEAQVREKREQLLVAMNGAGIKVLSQEKGCVMLKRATTAQRIDTRSLQLHKPDWYRAFCKTVSVPESLQIILIE